MSAIEREEQLTLEEFVRLYDQEGPFELIDGIRKPLMPNVPGHGWVLRALFRSLDPYCVTHRLGEVFMELPIVRLYTPTWVKGARVPDLMFFRISNWEPYVTDNPDWSKKPFLLVPDLVVEVISPHDSYAELRHKITGYLADGIQLVWVIDPDRKLVDIYEGEHVTTLGADETLTGGTVIPGFSMPVADLFSL